MTESNLPFEGPQSWPEKVFQADDIWAQVKAALEKAKVELPKTPRRPDVRLIVNNVSREIVTFQNPGDHSNSKPETIPGEGDKTAVMVMLAGDTLADQQIIAHQLTQRFGLDKVGLSPEFVEFLQTDEASEFVAEAYGPAPFEGQADKLVNVDWVNVNGDVIQIQPEKHAACAFGARAPAEEDAFLAILHIYVEGTSTTAELMENDGMVVAVARHWETGEETTRPIVPSVAQDFYGRAFYDIPKIVLSAEGNVQSIDLKNGMQISIDPENGAVSVLKDEYITSDVGLDLDNA